MNVEIEAVYEKGTLKLSRELPLREGQSVRLTLHDVGTGRTRAFLHWTGSKEDLEYLLGPDNHPWARDE